MFMWRDFKGFYPANYQLIIPKSSSGFKKLYLKKTVPRKGEG
jgi:hypothetical protein